MIVLPPLAVTVVAPPANLAVRIGVGIEIRRRGCRDGTLKTCPYASIVGRIVGNSVGLRLGKLGRYDVGIFRSLTLSELK